MRLILPLLGTVYSLLYHQFAWTYDLVAAVVSLGRWRGWVRCALPYLRGRVLEIGFGPGHLQVDMQAQGVSSFGVDESGQMVRQARHRMMNNGLQPGLTRGYARNLPFRNQAFNCVVSTFPSAYIFESQTLPEIWRVLPPGGTLVIIPMAWITGGNPLERSMAWLLRFVGETPGKPDKFPTTVKEQLNRAGFSIESELVEMKGSKVLVVVGTKRIQSPTSFPAGGARMGKSSEGERITIPHPGEPGGHEDRIGGKDGGGHWV